MGSVRCHGPLRAHGHRSSCSLACSRQDRSGDCRVASAHRDRQAAADGCVPRRRRRGLRPRGPACRRARRPSSRRDGASSRWTRARGRRRALARRGDRRAESGASRGSSRSPSSQRRSPVGAGAPATATAAADSCAATMAARFRSMRRPPTARFPPSLRLPSPARSAMARCRRNCASMPPSPTPRSRACSARQVSPSCAVLHGDGTRRRRRASRPRSICVPSPRRAPPQRRGEVSGGCSRPRSFSSGQRWRFTSSRASASGQRFASTRGAARVNGRILRWPRAFLPTAATTPQAARAALARRYALLRHAQGLAAPDDALPLLARATAALAALPPGTVKSALYADGHWTLELARADPAVVRDLDARMRAARVPMLVATSASGARVRIGGP